MQPALSSLRYGFSAVPRYRYQAVLPLRPAQRAGGRGPGWAHCVFPFAHSRWMLRTCLVAAVLCASLTLASAAADLILHNGRIVTVDSRFSVQSALAVTGNRLTAVGDADSILALKNAQTKVVDLRGKMVLPGLIDSHVHPEAAMTEFDHPIPVMESIEDILAYIRARAAVVPTGQWIH